MLFSRRFQNHLSHLHPEVSHMPLDLSSSFIMYSFKLPGRFLHFCEQTKTNAKNIQLVNSGSEIMTCFFYSCFYLSSIPTIDYFQNQKEST